MYILIVPFSDFYSFFPFASHCPDGPIVSVTFLRPGNIKKYVMLNYDQANIDPGSSVLNKFFCPFGWSDGKTPNPTPGVAQ